MTTQQTDADLIRELNDKAWRIDPHSPSSAKAFLRAAARIAELTQPAPLALSKEDAMVWNARVQAAQVTTSKSCIDEAILAVDALLRKRVTPLTVDEILDLWNAARAEGPEATTPMRFAVALYDAHGIGEGS